MDQKLVDKWMLKYRFKVLYFSLYVQYEYCRLNRLYSAKLNDLVTERDEKTAQKIVFRACSAQPQTIDLALLHGQAGEGNEGEEWK